MAMKSWKKGTHYRSGNEKEYTWLTHLPKNEITVLTNTARIEIKKGGLKFTDALSHPGAFGNGQGKKELWAPQARQDFTPHTIFA